MLLALLACARLYFRTVREDAAFKLIGVPLPHAAIWSAALFVALGAVVFLLTFGAQTGLKGLDARIRRVIDLLVDTELELNKVSWPSSNELTSSTTAVLVSIFLLGAFLFFAGMAISYVMSSLGVLPG
jgi:preprotein translocase SecE subunit